MKIVKDHGMARQWAKDTVDALLPTLVQRHGDSMSNPKGEWKEDVFNFSFEARGFKIKGTLEVTDTQVILDAKLPFLARPFEGMIRTNIERELDQILGK
jgi:hypothetical protein